MTMSLAQHYQLGAGSASTPKTSVEYACTLTDILYRKQSFCDQQLCSNIWVWAMQLMQTKTLTLPKEKTPHPTR